MNEERRLKMRYNHPPMAVLAVFLRPLQSRARQEEARMPNKRMLKRVRTAIRFI